MDTILGFTIICLLFVAHVKGSTYKINYTALISIPNDIPPSTTRVELIGNEITSIPSNAFDNLVNLDYVDLEGNKISSVSTDAFKSTKIKTLLLDNNTIGTVPYFANIDSTLTTLSMSNCSITNITWNLVLSYTNVKILKMANNQLARMPDLSKSKSRLRHLYLEGCGIQDIPQNYFAGFNGLRTLDLQNNTFVTLRDYAFAGLGSLTTLYFASNSHLTKTGWFAFSGLTKLAKLFMNDCGKLKTLPCVGPFSPNIKVFVVTDSNIESFPVNCSGFAETQRFLFSTAHSGNINMDIIVKSLTKVNSIDLNKIKDLCLEFDTINRLQNILTFTATGSNMVQFPVKNCSNTPQEPDHRAFNFTKLTKLDLSWNLLENFPNISLLINLQHLRLQHNKMTILPKKCFYFSKKLWLIDLSENLLTEAPDLSGVCGSLQKLRIGKNKILSLPPNYFQGCSKLQELMLYNNQFVAFPDLSQIGQSLTTVSFSSNLIGTLPVEAFRNLTKIQSLTFNKNNIKSFPVESLQYMWNLRSLNLEHTKLTGFGDPYRWCAGVTCNKLKLNIKGNNMCTEQMCWAKRHPKPIAIMIDGCFGKTWIKVTLEDLDCPDIKLMEISSNQGMDTLFIDSLPVSENLPKLIKDFSSVEHCANQLGRSVYY